MSELTDEADKAAEASMLAWANGLDVFRSHMQAKMDTIRERLAKEYAEIVGDSEESTGGDQ